MEKIFLYDNVNNRVELNEPMILLIREFKALWNNERNITKSDPTGKDRTRAFREFTYIYLAIDWQSPYANYTEGEKHEESLKDGEITEQEFNDPLFRAACRKYREIQEQNRLVKMLQAAQNAVDKFIDYFNNIDPEERDLQTGKPIYKVKTIMDEVNTLTKVIEELKKLEAQVRQELSESSNLRAGATDGFIPGGF